MKLVLSDPKTRKAYSKKIEDAGLFMSKRIGTEVALDPIGLPGYSAKITGGSDREGFPMKADLRGTARRKVMFLAGKHGKRLRRNMRGNTVSEETSQLNLAVTKRGSQGLDELLGKAGEKEGEKEGAEGKAEED